MSRSFSEDFLLLSFKSVGESVISTAKSRGCTYADFRFEKTKNEVISTKDMHVEAINYTENIGYGIKVVYKNTWGFAAGTDLSVESAIKVLEKAIKMADSLSLVNKYPVVLDSLHPLTDTYISNYEIDPFEIDLKDKTAYMLSITESLLKSKNINFVNFTIHFVEENKYFLSSDGVETTQKRVRSYPYFNVTSVDEKSSKYETLRSDSHPIGMGYEVLKYYDFESQAERIPNLIEQKVKAESIKPGKYDIVLDPTNLWLVIHESIGHATELDRVLGYESNYAGTSFATLDKLKKLQYGSSKVNIKADRIQDKGLSTIGYDDEGIAADEWYLIKDGILNDYQYNREIAARYNLGKSKGCAYAQSSEYFPIQRMANVSLMPSNQEISTNDLISQVENGIYIVGDNSWSIDMQRYNFQFTGQLFYKIKNGKIDGMYRDVAYQSNTVNFWNACDAVGGNDTYRLLGSFYCGKGQPAQIAPVSHGAPSALFRNINILNTQNEN